MTQPLLSALVSFPFLHFFPMGLYNFEYYFNRKFKSKRRDIHVVNLPALNRSPREMRGELLFLHTMKNYQKILSGITPHKWGVDKSEVPSPPPPPPRIKPRWTWEHRQNKALDKEGEIRDKDSGLQYLLFWVLLPQCGANKELWGNCLISYYDLACFFSTFSHLTKFPWELSS